MHESLDINNTSYSNTWELLFSIVNAYIYRYACILKRWKDTERKEGEIMKTLLTFGWYSAYDSWSWILCKGELRCLSIMKSYNETGHCLSVCIISDHWGMWRHLVVRIFFNAKSQHPNHPPLPVRTFYLSTPI